MNKFEIKIYNSLSEELNKNWQDFEKKSFHCKRDPKHFVGQAYAGNGRILVRQGIGGGGIGLDLGFVTKRNDLGWKFGFLGSGRFGQ